MRKFERMVPFICGFLCCALTYLNGVIDGKEYVNGQRNNG